ncbi:L,D-transpeptidase [Cellulomonas sp. DKR-3]|uniref:L,D-transpeptidase n=1 Tax=Cellulomonas fulva TaxID=2835530 RepID=A0ABS5TXQ4_9CELL|nr:L,D-transpeptidase [Cellulomonas fulva]
MRSAVGVLAATAALGCVALSGCSAPPTPRVQPTVAAVVDREPVDVAKVAVPPPAPAVDLTGLTVVDPKHVVAGLPGLGDRTQLASEDPALGRWRTAVVVRDTAAYDEPGGTAVGVLPAQTLGVSTVVPVVETAPGWLRVMVAARGALPSADAARVNERTAWVRTVDTRAAGTDWRITVDTAAQTLTVDDGTGRVVHPVIATGSPSRPTPRGPQFVVGTFWEEPGSVTPRVVLLSSQSETMDAYDRVTGTSATAIHTTTLASRGEVSNGCVRVADDVLDVLWRAVPPGTLVLVEPTGGR